MCWVPNPEAVPMNMTVLAILVGNATNQGIYGMAQISDRTYDQLALSGGNYLHLKPMNAANDNINNATASYPSSRYYNIEGRCDPHSVPMVKKFEARLPETLQNPLFVVLWPQRCFCHDLDRQSRCDQHSRVIITRAHEDRTTSLIC